MHLGLGIVLPFEWNPLWQQVACAALLAAQQLNGTFVNAWSPAPVRAAAAAGLRVSVPVVYSNEGTRSGTLQGYVSAHAAGVDAIVGAALSSNSMLLGLLGGGDGIPNMAIWSSNPDLSDKKEFPYHARTYPSDAVACEVIAALVHAFGWSTIGVLHLTDTYGEGFRSQIIMAAERLEGLTVQVTAAVTLDDEATFGPALDQLEPVNIIVVALTGSAASIGRLMSAAAARGMLGAGHVWIATDGFVHESNTPHLEGLLRLGPIAEGKQWTMFQSMWRQASDAQCAAAGVVGAFDSDPFNVGAYAYDAVLALGSAALISGSPGNASALHGALRNVGFDGASGSVGFDQHGDRLPVGMRWGLENLVRVATGNTDDLEFVTVGEIDLNGMLNEPSLRHVVPIVGADGASRALDDIVWLGGATDTPRDNYGQTSNIGLTVYAVIAAVLSAFLLAVIARSIMKRMRKYRRLARQRQEQLMSTVQEAIAMASDLQFAAVLVPAHRFMSIGSLRMYEDLRDAGDLHFVDSLESLNRRQHRYVFFSHQWTSWTAPDPTGHQYAVMCAALKHVAECYEWKLEDTYVWCDLCSIPQRCRSVQKLGIGSLTQYAALASAFIVVAPALEHADTKSPCNYHSYQKRMWCKCEQLSHWLHNGRRRMWVATTVTDCQPIGFLRQEGSALSPPPERGERRAISRNRWHDLQRIGVPEATAVSIAIDNHNRLTPTHGVRVHEVKVVERVPNEDSHGELSPVIEVESSRLEVKVMHTGASEGETGSSESAAPSGRPMASAQADSPLRQGARHAGHAPSRQSTEPTKLVPPEENSLSQSSVRSNTRQQSRKPSRRPRLLSKETTSRNASGTARRSGTWRENLAWFKREAEANPYGDEWLVSTIQVFKGEATQDSDRASLVMPLLGMYAQLWACRTQLDDFEEEAAAVLSVIQQRRDEIFPDSWHPADGGAKIELFGNKLCNLMEQHVDSNAELRATLQEAMRLRSRGTHTDRPTQQPTGPGALDHANESFGTVVMRALAADRDGANSEHAERNETGLENIPRPPPVMVGSCPDSCAD